MKQLFFGVNIYNKTQKENVLWLLLIKLRKLSANTTPNDTHRPTVRIESKNLCFLKVEFLMI